MLNINDIIMKDNMLNDIDKLIVNLKYISDFIKKIDDNQFEKTYHRLLKTHDDIKKLLIKTNQK